MSGAPGITLCQTREKSSQAISFDGQRVTNMHTISDVMEAAKIGFYVKDLITENMNDSEGKQGSAHVAAKSHVLQHIAVLNSTPVGEFNPLKSDYHLRGPVKYKPSTDELVGQQISSHSQFKTQAQAAMCMSMALCSKGGLRALELLKDTDCTIKLTYGLPGGLTTSVRSAQVLDKDPLSTSNFVLVTDKDPAAVILELHKSNRTPNGLHFQSAYPAWKGPAPGVSILEITSYPGATKSKEEL
jgi:hypothetical protein